MMNVKRKTYCIQYLLQLNRRGNEERRYFKHMTKNNFTMKVTVMLKLRRLKILMSFHILSSLKDSFVHFSFLFLHSAILSCLTGGRHSFSKGCCTEKESHPRKMKKDGLPVILNECRWLFTERGRVICLWVVRILLSFC